MTKKRLRDVVILLPGITGSVLQRDGEDVWAPTAQALWSAAASLGASLQSLRLDQDDAEIDDLGDGVRATRLMPDATFIPGYWKIDGYSSTVRMFTDHFQIERGSVDAEHPANFFEFPYDWRRDCRVAARQLKRLVDRQLPIWREASGAKDARVILVAHSMGGLVARHYLEVLQGWRDCRISVTFGTPYGGSLKILNFLANGYKKTFLELSDVLRSFTSSYQLLPTYKVVRRPEGYVRVADLEDVPGIERAKAQAALDFHRAVEVAVEAHQDERAYVEGGYTNLPIVGTRQPTLQSATLEGGRLSVSRALPEWVDELLDDGDGTVPRISAIPSGMSREYRNTFAAECHGSLQRNLQVLENLRGWLEQSQVPSPPKLLGPEVSAVAASRSAIALDLEDLYLADEPFVLRAYPVNMSEDQSLGDLEARIEPINGLDGRVLRRVVPGTSGEWVLRIDDLPPGLYRVRVQTKLAGETAPAPVHDLFAVAG